MIWERVLCTIRWAGLVYFHCVCVTVNIPVFSLFYAAPPVCKCESGLSGQPNAGEAGCTDPCTDACATATGSDTVAATCQNSGGQALCTCPSNSNGNAYAGGSCTVIPTCANTECAADQTCSESSGSPVCVNVCDGACAAANGVDTVAANCQVCSVILVKIKSQ